jgi:serine phosphatase RsbU (regulator of sigma subunit)
MRDDFWNYQQETTLRNLYIENKHLKEEIERLKQETTKDRNILDFHDQLEKDSFSLITADSSQPLTLETLTLRLINRLTIRPDIDLVTVCLSRDYLESVFFARTYQQFLPKIGVSVIDESDLEKYVAPYRCSFLERTPVGSTGVFFPGHEEQVRSQTIIPLFLRGRTIGSLNIGSFLTRHHYNTEMGPELLGRLSAKLAIAIDNILLHQRLDQQKELLDREIDQAAALQKSLLPEPVFRTRWLRVDTFFRPCLKLGGDFFDLITISSERLAVVVADVAGHGISAALIAAMLKFSLQIDDIESLPPHELLGKINRKFCHILRGQDYITLCYTVIDAKSSSMDLARAGHPFPMLYRSSANDILELEPSGPPIGLDSDASYETMRVSLTSGDILFLYTDGLTDSVFDQRTNRTQALKMWLLSLTGKHAADAVFHKLVAGLEGSLENRELDDDLSLIVVSTR